MWIACKDKMPEDGQRVLIWRPSQTFFKEPVDFGYRRISAHGPTWALSIGGDIAGVTHWQPLPPAPSQEK